MINIFKKFYEALLGDNAKKSNAFQLAKHLAGVLNYEKKGVDMLYPDLADKYGQLEKIMAEKKMPIKIFQTFRSAKEQDQKYSQGRDKGGRIITNARGYQSYHQYGLAVDIVFKDYGWNPPFPAWWKDLGDEGKKLGLIWGGDWKLRDYAHFEWHPGFSWKEVVNFFIEVE